MKETRKNIYAFAKRIEALPAYDENYLDGWFYFKDERRRIYTPGAEVILINALRRKLLIKALRYYARREDMPRIPPRRR